MNKAKLLQRLYAYLEEYKQDARNAKTRMDNYANKEDYKRATLVSVEVAGANAAKFAMGQSVHLAENLDDHWSHLACCVSPETLGHIYGDVWHYRSQNEPDSITVGIADDIEKYITKYYTDDMLDRFFQSDPYPLNRADFVGVDAR